MNKGPRIIGAGDNEDAHFNKKVVAWMIENQASGERKREVISAENATECQWIEEYKELATLHGTKYLLKSSNTPTERLCWATILFLSVTLSFYLSCNMIYIWQSDPIFTSIDDSQHDLSNVLFPAVTICPSAHIVVGQLMEELCIINFTKPENVTLPLHKLLDQALSPYLNRKRGHIMLQGQTSHAHYDHFIGLSDEVIQIIKKVSPHCNDYLKECYWDGKRLPCNSLFHLDATDDGFCCSFNNVAPKERFHSSSDFDEIHQKDAANKRFSSAGEFLGHLKKQCPYTPLNEEDWNASCNFDEWFQMEGTFGEDEVTSEVFDTTLKTPPGDGTHHGLQVLIGSLPCGWLPTDIFLGSKVLIHEPIAFPEISTKGLPVTPESVNFVAVKAETIETTLRTKWYKNTTRKCNFDGEQELQFYKAYSRENCMIENKIVIYEEICGCRPFYLPGSAPPCSATQMECVSSDLVHNRARERDDRCLPSCEKTQYAATMSTVPWQPQVPGDSMLRVFFSESFVVKFRRDQVYSFEDVVANIGGTLGLGTGISLVTVIELIYFCTCRKYFKSNPN